MSYKKAMKHWRNPRKYKKAQPILMHSDSFNGAKSIWADEKQCLKCGYDRPVFFFGNKIDCDMCQAVEKGADREKLSFMVNNSNYEPHPPSG